MELGRERGEWVSSWEAHLRSHPMSQNQDLGLRFGHSMLPKIRGIKLCGGSSDCPRLDMGQVCITIWGLDCAVR